MRYGIENEHLACTMFVKQLEERGLCSSLRECGLFVCNEHGELAATPDRVGHIDGEKVVVEVKCLSASRDVSPFEAVRHKQKDSNFAFRLNEKQIQLKEHHAYYYQVQMQMGIVGVNTAYVVIFTSVQNPVVWFKLPFDNNFWQEKQQKLLDFHANFVIPALVTQRF